MNTKTIYIILAVIVVAFLGYYFLNNQTPTNQLPTNNSITDETNQEPVQNEPGDTLLPVSDDGYHTYTSDTYGFSIDYPKDWYWDATNPGQLFIMSPERKKIEGTDIEAPIDVVVSVYKSLKELPNNQDGLDFENWIEQISNDPGFVEKTEIIIDGVKGYQGISQGMSRSYTIFVENNNFIYSIYTGNSVLPGVIKQTIIDSFKFI